MRSGRAHWFLMVSPDSSVFEETIHFCDQRKEFLGALPGRGLVREAVPDLTLFSLCLRPPARLSKRTD